MKGEYRWLLGQMRREAEREREREREREIYYTTVLYSLLGLFEVNGHLSKNAT